MEQSTTHPYLDPNDAPWTEEWIENHQQQWDEDHYPDGSTIDEL